MLDWVKVKNTFLNLGTHRINQGNTAFLFPSGKLTIRLIQIDGKNILALRQDLPCPFSNVVFCDLHQQLPFKVSIANV